MREIERGEREEERESKEMRRERVKS